MEAWVCQPELTCSSRAVLPGGTGSVMEPQLVVLLCLIWVTRSVSPCRCADKPALPEHAEIPVAEQTLREN